MSKRAAGCLKIKAFPAVRMTQKGKWCNPRALAYLSWKEAVGYLLKGMKLPFLEGDISAVITFSFKKSCRADIDNLIKGVFDAMQGVLFKNDRQVKAVRAAITEDIGEDKIEFLLEEKL